ncbi:hypothetical protein [Allokutzneria sp. NRRL B-24872]|uniref:hypothetical protein n=1 Tax=Allokutzneria sp. NRRL B-24872 TaxID=1137961 RepID=UPI0011784414|nr:hypothetical protein [Allokutzneria sp. NRRL B-24872]
MMTTTMTPPAQRGFEDATTQNVITAGVVIATALAPLLARGSSRAVRRPGFADHVVRASRSVPQRPGFTREGNPAKGKSNLGETTERVAEKALKEFLEHVAETVANATDEKLRELHRDLQRERERNTRDLREARAAHVAGLVDPRDDEWLKERGERRERRLQEAMRKVEEQMKNADRTAESEVMKSWNAASVAVRDDNEAAQGST